MIRQDESPCWDKDIAPNRHFEPSTVFLVFMLLASSADDFLSPLPKHHNLVDTLPCNQRPTSTPSKSSAQRQCPVPPLDPEANAREQWKSAIAPIASAVPSRRFLVQTGQAFPPCEG
jgi:hypothetical protein